MYSEGPVSVILDKTKEKERGEKREVSRTSGAQSLRGCRRTAISRRVGCTVKYTHSLFEITQIENPKVQTGQYVDHINRTMFSSLLRRTFPLDFPIFEFTLIRPSLYRRFSSGTSPLSQTVRNFCQRTFISNPNFPRKNNNNN